MADKQFEGFDTRLVKFLKDLSKHNERDWFQANKARYEGAVREPVQAFVRAIAPRLAKISSQIVASDKKVGGSMMRINRDVRFSKDKRPYNTSVKMQFRHSVGKGNVAPGFFLGIDTDQVAFGTGIWRPDNPTLKQIRDHIVANPAAWKKARDGKAFRAAFGDLEGESLKRVPRGYDADHPLGEDLKRKDFVAFRHEPVSAILGAGFLDEVVATYKVSKPFCTFIADALGMPF